MGSRGRNPSKLSVRLNKKGRNIGHGRKLFRDGMGELWDRVKVIYLEEMRVWIPLACILFHGNFVHKLDTWDIE